MNNYETCRECNAQTGRAGPSEDSLFHGYVGPFCEDCYCDWPDKIEAELAQVRREFRAFREDQAASEPVAEVAQVGGSPVVFWDKSLPVGTKLYTHPASAEVERLQARVAEKCDAPTGWIDPDKYKAACESKMEFFKTIKELREQNEKLQARVAELESDEQEMSGDNNV